METKREEDLQKALSELNAKYKFAVETIIALRENNDKLISKLVYMELNAGAIGRDTVKRSMRPNCGE
jgi:hypothetical protein